MAIAYVKDTGKIVGDAVASMSGSFATLPSVGNLCVSTLATASFLVTVSDNQSNTYTVDQVDLPPSGVGYTLDSAQIATSAGTFTVTWDPTFSADQAAMAIEFSGIVTSSRLDKTADAFGFGSNLSVGPTATLSQADELVVSMIGCDDGGEPLDYPSGYTGLWEEEDPTYAIGAAAYKIVASTTAVSAGWTNSAIQSTAGIVTYKAIAGPSIPILGQVCL